MSTTVLIEDKAKPIDKVLEEHAEQDCGHEDVIVWPTSPQENTSSKPVEIQDEDLLGYGEAEPTPQNRAKPRRSSLSGANPQRLSHRRASIGYSGEMTLTLPTKETVVKRRSITFSDDDTVHSFTSKNQDDDVTRQLWFRQGEYRHIENNIRKIVQDSRYSKERPTWLDTETRGLEGALDATIGEERHNVIQSVLEDQKQQKEMGVFDEEMIASTYQYNSMDAQLMAADRGKKDEEEVQDYLENTKRIIKIQQRRMSC